MTTPTRYYEIRSADGTRWLVFTARHITDTLAYEAVVQVMTVDADGTARSSKHYESLIGAFVAPYLSALNGVSYVSRPMDDDELAYLTAKYGEIAL